MRFASIQVLRGVAASSIFVFHLVATLDRYSPAELKPHVARLTLGVDLFFLISGFVMAHSVRNMAGPANAADFLARRIWRIVPLLYLVTAACVGMMLLRGEVIEPARVINGIAIWPILPTVNRYPFALIPAWTLAYEMAFYLLVAGAVALRWNRVILIALVLPFAMVFPMMAEFAVGVALYELWTRYPGLARTSLEWTPTSAIGRAGLFLGTISYSLYLTHVVTFDALAPLCLFVPLPVAGAIMAGAGIGIAFLTYKAVEEPLMTRSAGTRLSAA